MKDGSKFLLEGKDLSIGLKTPYGKQEILDYSVNGNVIEWTFLGKDQKFLGKYSLILVVNKNDKGMVTTDACNFVELVACSCEANGADEAGVQTESIDLISSIEGASYDDTELREELTRLDGELTELSSQVGGLSERVEDLEQGGQGGEQEVFKAEYGVTTFAEVKAANEAGKVVICNYNGYVFRLTRVMDSELTFVANNVGYIHLLYLTKFDVWWSNYADVRHELKDLDNGNVQLTIAGKSAEVATPQYVENAIQQSGGGASTPSGDPMHYMFEAVGATYNATDADIPMVGMYGDSYVHKAHHWHLNELGDITNDEMREIYAKTANLCNMIGLDRALASTNVRTNIPIVDRELPLMGAFSRMSQNMTCFAANSQCETISVFSPTIPMTSATMKEYNLSEGNAMFFGCKKLKKVLNAIPITKLPSVNRLIWEAPIIEEVRLYGLKASIEVKHTPVLSNASILYMIENATATGITITLHADAYDRAMADSAITAAMESKQVNLAKA